MSNEPPTERPESEHQPLDPRLQQLADGLRQAYCSPDREDLTRLVMAQDRHVDALIAVANFANHCVCRNVRDQLGALAGAINDLRSGTQSPLLAVTPHRGRAHDPSEVWAVRARAIIGLECYIAREEHPAKAPERAAARIAAKYPGLSALLRDSEADLATSLLSWWNAFRNKRLANMAAQGSYNDMMDMLAEVSGEQRGANADKLLSSAELSAKALFGSE
jgi:hypothetical protein